jgi:hypothetical protein
MAHELAASLQYGFRYGSIRNLFDVRFIQSAVTAEYSPECEQTKCSSNLIFLYINKATSLEYCLSSKPSLECIWMVAGPGSGPGSSISELWWTAWHCDGFFSDYCRFASYFDSSNAPYPYFVHVQVTPCRQCAGVAPSASLGQNKGKNIKCVGQ